MSHGESHDLVVALQAVNRARSMVESARTRRVVERMVTSEHWRLLAALEGYAAILASHGHPMPYRCAANWLCTGPCFTQGEAPTGATPEPSRHAA